MVSFTSLRQQLFISTDFINGTKFLFKKVTNDFDVH